MGFLLSPTLPLLLLPRVRQGQPWCAVVCLWCEKSLGGEREEGEAVCSAGCWRRSGRAQSSTQTAISCLFHRNLKKTRALSDEHHRARVTETNSEKKEESEIKRQRWKFQRCEFEVSVCPHMAPRDTLSKTDTCARERLCFEREDRIALS